MKATEYYTSVEKLKFKQTDEGATPTILATLQRYLKQLNKRDELDDDAFNKIRPQSARIARVHRLPKMHRHFDNNPPFQSIVDTIGTTHWENTYLNC